MIKLKRIGCAPNGYPFARLPLCCALHVWRSQPTRAGIYKKGGMEGKKREQASRSRRRRPTCGTQIADPSTAHSHPARAAAALSFDPAPGVQDPLRGVPNLGKIDRACFISSVNLFSTFHRITGALLNLLFHVQGGGKMSQRHCSRGSKFEQFHDGLCSCGCTTAEDPRATTRQRLQWQSRR
jgi:hypothetical protein